VPPPEKPLSARGLATCLLILSDDADRFYADVTDPGSDAFHPVYVWTPRGYARVASARYDHEVGGVLLTLDTDGDA
jgi:hypothetical protein